jgi:hypothetical protein
MALWIKVITAAAIILTITSIFKINLAISKRLILQKMRI